MINGIDTDRLVCECGQALCELDVQNVVEPTMSEILDDELPDFHKK